MDNLKACRYGKNCDRVKNGTCTFQHPRCINGAKCQYLSNQNCGFYHTNKEHKDYSIQNMDHFADNSNQISDQQQLNRNRKFHTRNNTHEANKRSANQLLTEPKLNGIPDFNLRLNYSDIYAICQRKPFAEGACRYAYAGLMNRDDIEDGRNRGDKVVIKKWKSKHVFNKDFWERDLKCYRVAGYLINTWNKMRITHAMYKLCTPSRRICTTPCNKLENDDIALNEWVIVEKYLSGKFIKWNSNSGYVHHEQMSIHAFCHWTYHQSNGKYVMCDAQGTNTEASNGKWYYSITDPCICSKDQRYGATDVGLRGILSFFANHKCNTFCKNWNKPNFIDPKKLLAKRMTSTYQWNAIFP